MIKTIISVKDYKKAYKELSKVKNSITTILESKDNKTTISKFNEENELRIQLDSEVIEEGKISLAEELTKMLSKLKTNELNFNDKEKNYIYNSNRKIKLNSEEINIKDILSNKEVVDSFSISSKELLRLLQVENCRSEDEIRPILQGVNFKNNKVCALDGYRLSLRTSTEMNNNSDFIINSEAVNILLSLLKSDDTIVNFNIYNDYVKIYFNEYTLISKLLEGSYIKYEQIITSLEDNNYIIKIKDTKEFIESVSFIQESNKIYKDKTKNILVWNIVDNKMNIKTTDNSIEELLSYSEIVKQNKSVDIGINTKYLLEAIKKYKDEEVYIIYKSPVEPIYITNNNDNNDNIEMILPVRLMK